MRHFYSSMKALSLIQLNDVVRILGGAHEHIASVQTFRENNIEKAKDLLLANYKMNLHTYIK